MEDRWIRKNRIVDFYGQAMIVKEVLEIDGQNILILREFGKDNEIAVPKEVVRKIHSVNVGFYDHDDETQFDTDDMEELDELVEGFCAENGFGDYDMSYIEIGEDDEQRCE